ncbi:hypothetical protein GOODEAATRI_007406, partial [Goodea atripinnis]
DADRARIAELEKAEAELCVEVSRLQKVSDVTMSQVSALQARQKSNDKEVEGLRRQILDYQSQSDEKALIAKLYQHIVALQLSESATLTSSSWRPTSCVLSSGSTAVSEHCSSPAKRAIMAPLTFGRPSSLYAGSLLERCPSNSRRSSL